VIHGAQHGENYDARERTSVNDRNIRAGYPQWLISDRNDLSGMPGMPCYWHSNEYEYELKTLNEKHSYRIHRNRQKQN